METGWLISYLLLWLITVLMGLVLLAHSRLLGVLHHRFGPSSAKPLADGPELGAQLDALSGHQLDGTEWTWSFPAAADLVLVFMSPQCTICDEVLPHVEDFAQAHREVHVVVMSVLDEPGMNRAYVAYRGLKQLPYVMAAKTAYALNIEGTPYALAITRHGRVSAKGLVNHYEHLLSLIEPPAVSLAPESSNPQPMAERRSSG